MAQQWLIDELNDEVVEVVLADGGYNDGGQYFIMPSGQHNYVDKMMTDARAQHENSEQTIEGLQHAMKGQLEWHHNVFARMMTL